MAFVEVPYRRSVLVDDVFCGVVEGPADTGDLIVRGFTGPAIVVLPLRLATGLRAGAELRYRIVPVDGARWFVVRELLA